MCTCNKFSEYFNSLEKVRGLGKNKIIKDSGLDRTYGYQLLDLTKNKHLGRDKIIALSIAAGLDMKEMRRGLEIGGYSPLYSRDRRDAVPRFEHQFVEDPALRAFLAFAGGARFGANPLERGACLPERGVRLVGVLEFGELVSAIAVFGSSHAVLPLVGLTLPAGPSGREGKGGGVAEPRRGDASPHSRRGACGRPAMGNCESSIFKERKS